MAILTAGLERPLVQKFNQVEWETLVFRTTGECFQYINVFEGLVIQETVSFRWTNADMTKLFMALSSCRCRKAMK